ncbi:MAG: TetR/AcrR family transcriptional regulator [Planctomycetes bacterium]|nr:TetR/AcrR family transcriptional regulator [Planctomycetota bacterium]
MKKRLMARSVDTRVRILDAAETMLAERGIEATSMRAITSSARVNLAAVNYHFGSKEGLIIAVYGRRLGPVNQERLAMLDAAERAAERPTLDAILRSYIAPVMQLIHDPARGGEIFMRLLGRALYEPGDYLGQLFREEMEPMLNRFTIALQSCLPHLTSEELFWRMHFGGGALAYTCAQIHRLELLSKGACNPQDVQGVISRLVDFIAAGMLSGERLAMTKNG